MDLVGDILILENHMNNDIDLTKHKRNAQIVIKSNGEQTFDHEFSSTWRVCHYFVEVSEPGNECIDDSNCKFRIFINT